MFKVLYYLFTAFFKIVKTKDRIQDCKQITLNVPETTCNVSLVNCIETVQNNDTLPVSVNRRNIVLFQKNFEVSIESNVADGSSCYSRYN